MARYSVCCALLLLAGCGSDSDETGGAGGASGSSGTAGAAADAGGASGGGAGTSSGGLGGGSGGGAASGGAGGAGAGGAGTGGASTGGTGTGGAGGANTGGTGTGAVQCGPATCNLQSQFCCAQYNQTPQCKAHGGTCTYSVEVRCDGPEDCPGQVCCGKLFIQGKNKSYTDLSCQASCDKSDENVICGAAGSCPGSMTCKTSLLLPPYRDCQ